MKNLICIVCPKGCHLSVDENNVVSGNTCPRGSRYAIQELTSPTRMITSTVKIINSEQSCLPVMTENPIPKDKIFEVMEEINKITVSAPINCRDIVIKDVLGLGINIIATKTILK